MAGKNLPFTAKELFNKFSKASGGRSKSSGNGRQGRGDDFASQLRKRVEQEEAGVSILQLLLERPGEHLWKNNSVNLGDVEAGTYDANDKPAVYCNFAEHVLEGTVPEQIAVLSMKEWEIWRQKACMKAGLTKSHDDINSIFSLMTGNEFVRGGNFLDAYSSKVGAIFRNPIKVNNYDYYLSQENMEFYKNRTSNVDYVKFNEALRRIPHFRSILESDIDFYRSYLDGMSDVPLTNTLLARLKLYSSEQIEFRRSVDILLKAFNHNMYLPERIKNTVTQIKSENTVRVTDYMRGGSVTLSKKRTLEQSNTLDVSTNWKIINPTLATKNLFGGILHSFQRSNTNKLLKQLGVQGLLDQAVVEQTQNGGYSFSEYYLNMLGQTNNQVRTVKLNDMNSTVMNAPDELRKAAYIPLNIIILDNIVYTTSSSLSMNVMSEGRHTNIELESRTQLIHFINKLFALGSWVKRVYRPRYGNKKIR